LGDCEEEICESGAAPSCSDRAPSQDLKPCIEREDLSFSWYCRLPIAFAVAGTADRTGDAIVGLAPFASTLPAWAGTAAATLLNIADECVCSREVIV
jgi:hypothetical protein